MFRKTSMLCQRTSLKRWFGNRTMTSNCDVTNSAYQIQMILCHWMKPPPIKIFCVRHCSVVVWPQIFRLTFCSFWVVLKTWPYLGLFACGITFRKFQHSKWLYVLSHKYACLPDSWNCPITLLTRKIEIIDEWRRMINNSHWYVINRSNFLSAVCGLKSSQ